MIETISRRRRLFGATAILTAATLAVAGCTTAGASPSPSAGPAISVTGAWARPSVGATGNSAAYFTITNSGPAADTLTGASSPIGTAELHETTMMGSPGMSAPAMGSPDMSAPAMSPAASGMDMGGGMTGMQPVASVEVPAGGTVAFAPGGYHVMLTGLTKPLSAGDTFELTLTFQKAGPVVLSVQVRPN